MKRKQQRREYIVHLGQLPAINSESTKKGYRMSTHLFHAKRMKMEDQWGFRMAVEHITDKIFRNAYRFIRRHCTIHERSYMVCLQIDFNTSGNLEKLLKSMMHINHQSKLPFHVDYLEGKREGSFEWKDRDNFTISTVEFLVRPKVINCEGGEECLMMWIHPSSLPESYDLLQSLVHGLKGTIHHRNDLSRFEVRGPLTMKTISNVIRMHSQDTVNEMKGNKVECDIRTLMQEWDRMRRNIQNATSLPVDMAISFMAKHPIYTSSFNMPFEEFKRESLVLANSVASVPQSGEQDLNSLQKKMMVYVPDHLNELGLIWNQQQMKAKYHFPYLRKNKRTVKMANNMQSAEGPKSYPVILIQKASSLNSGSSMGGGFDIIVPTVDVSAHVWSKLSQQKNTMALPLFDRNRLLLEQGKRVFPNDYPSSKAFQRDFMKDNEVLTKTVENLNCPLSSYQLVHVFGIWGGSFEPHDEIYVPTNPAQIRELSKRAKSKVNNENRELLPKMHAIHKDLIEAKCIGFVTSSNYSLLRGKKYGLGFVAAGSDQVLPPIPGHSQNIALIKRREESNEYFYPVQIAVASKGSTRP